MKGFLAALAVLAGCAHSAAPSQMDAPDASRRPEARPEATEEARGEARPGTDGAAEENLSFDANFIDGMIAYTTYTKQLAEIGARRAQKEELRVFSENLATEQAARVEELQNWRGLWFDKARVRAPTLEQAAQNMEVPPYEFGVAWKAKAIELDPKHPEKVQSVAIVAGVEQWGPEQQFAALKELPDDAFDAFYTATLVQNDIWGLQVAHASLQRLEHEELQTVGQEIVTDNLIRLNQVARWRNDWFGAETEGMGPPEEPGMHEEPGMQEEPGTR